jgi:hypothetical protein
MAKGSKEFEKEIAEVGGDSGAAAASATLHEAARQGNVATIIVCLAAGADVNQTNADGYTPLHFAAEGGHVEAVHALLDGGAAVDQANQYGVTPLFIAAFHGRVEVIRTLLDRGANINQANARGKTPLDAANTKGHGDAIARIVEKREEASRWSVTRAAWIGAVMSFSIPQTGAARAVVKPEGVPSSEPELEKKRTSEKESQGRDSPAKK